MIQGWSCSGRTSFLEPFGCVVRYWCGSTLFFPGKLVTFCVRYCDCYPENFALHIIWLVRGGGEFIKPTWEGVFYVEKIFIGEFESRPVLARGDVPFPQHPPMVSNFKVHYAALYVSCTCSRTCSNHFRFWSCELCCRISCLAVKCLFLQKQKLDNACFCLICNFLASDLWHRMSNVMQQCLLGAFFFSRNRKGLFPAPLIFHFCCRIFCLAANYCFWVL